MKKTKLTTVIISAVLTLATIMPITVSAKSQYNEINSMKNVSYRLNNSRTLYEIGNIDTLVYIDDNGRISSTGDVSILHDIDESKLDNLYYIDKSGKKVTVNDVNEIRYTNEKGYTYITGSGPNNKTSTATLSETSSNAFWKYDASGKWHWIDNNSETIGWKVIGDNKYYFDFNGEMHVGWLELDGKKYYFNNPDGYMVKNTKITIDGKVYSFYANGSLKENTDTKKTGWVKDEFDLSGSEFSCDWRYVYANGENCIGWLQDNGYWYYFEKCGHMVKNQMRKIDGKVYWFDSSGHIKLNTTEYPGYTQRFINHTGPTDGSGIVCKTFLMKVVSDATGVCTITDYPSGGYIDVGNMLCKSHFHYLNDGSCHTILFDKNGDQVFGWFLESTCVSSDVATGITTLADRWTYYDENGIEVRNTSKVIDGKTYSFDSKGYLI